MGSAPIDIQSKATHFEVAKLIAQRLTIHANVGLQHLLTSSESCLASDYTPSRMWTMMRNDVDLIARQKSHPQKIMMTIFFGFKRIALIDIFPEKSN
jgi:hypothetical protein